MDDLKVSQKNEDTATAFALKLAKIYGPNTTISRGRVHEYLRMEIDWGTEPGTMIVSVIKYLQKVIEEFPESLNSTKALSSGEHVFKIREEEDRNMLSEEQAQQSHRTVSCILVLCKRAHPDIETLVSLLRTKVK